MKKTLSQKNTQSANGDSPEAKYRRWLEAFGAWLSSRSGRALALANDLGVSPQSVSRYFVHHTHDCPAPVFIRALVWQETKRARVDQLGWSRNTYPGIEFQTWRFAGVVPDLESLVQ